MKTLKNVTCKVQPQVIVVDSVFDITAALNSMRKEEEGKNKLTIVDTTLYISDTEEQELDCEEVPAIEIENFRAYFEDSDIYCVRLLYSVHEDGDLVFSEMVMNKEDFDAMFVVKEVTPKQIRATTAQKVLEYVLKETSFSVNSMKENAVYVRNYSNYGKSKGMDFVIRIVPSKTFGDVVYLFDEHTYSRCGTNMNGLELHSMAVSACKFDPCINLMPYMKERYFNCFEEA